jgi:hypothetical protein
VICVYCNISHAAELWAEFEVIVGTTDETVITIECFVIYLQGVTANEGSNIENIFTKNSPYLVFETPEMFIVSIYEGIYALKTMLFNFEDSVIHGFKIILKYTRFYFFHLV